ncbi:MAG: AsmA family protein [Beijerinckiaceae bacterium]
MRFNPSLLKLSDQRLRSPWFIAGVACLALIIFAGSFPYRLSRSFIEPRLQQALKRDTGYSVDTIAKASFSAFPWPSIRLEGLELTKPGEKEERLSIPVLKARLNLASWISGHPRITGLTLMRPVLNITGDADMIETEAMSATVFHELGRNKRPELSSLRVIDGRVSRNAKPWITGLNLNVINLVGQDMRVRAHASVQGLPVRVSSDINQTGGRARRPIRWTISTSAGEVNFAGLLLGSQSLDAEGEFNLVVKDAGLLTDRFRLDHAYTGFLSGMSVSGETKVTLPLIQIREATVLRGDETMTGSLEFNLGKSRPAVSATLHAAKFDVLPLVTPFISPLVNLNGSWSTNPFSHRWMQTLQLDMRLSAEEAIVGRHTLQNAALSAQMNAGRLELTLNDARLNGGSAKSKLLFNTAGNAPEMRLTANLERLDFGALLGGWNIHRLKGTGALNLQLDSSGSTALDVVKNLTGRVTTSIRDGELTGFDLDRMMARQERANPVLTQVDGRTRFQRLQSDMRVRNGTVTLGESSVSRGPISIPLSGTVQLPSQLLDLTLKLPAIPFRDPASDAGIRIEGPWSNPAIYPDLTGKIPQDRLPNGKSGRT